MLITVFLGYILGILTEKYQDKNIYTLDKEEIDAAFTVGETVEEEIARLAAEEAARLKMLEELIEEEEVVEEVVKDTLPPAPQPYQINRFTVGVRGGLASLMPQTSPSAPKPLGATWGFDVPYMLTGALNIHPSSAIKFIKDGRTDYSEFYKELLEDN